MSFMRLYPDFFCHNLIFLECGIRLLPECWIRIGSISTRTQNYPTPCSGNVLNGTIGKQMVDTLVESTANVEVSTKYKVHSSR